MKLKDNESRTTGGRRTTKPPSFALLWLSFHQVPERKRKVFPQFARCPRAAWKRNQEKIYRRPARAEGPKRRLEKISVIHVGALARLGKETKKKFIGARREPKAQSDGLKESA